MKVAASTGMTASEGTYLSLLVNSLAPCLVDSLIERLSGKSVD